MDWGAIHPDMGLSLERQQAANERVFRCFSFHLVLIPPRSHSTSFSFHLVLIPPHFVQHRVTR